jgi:glutaminase
LTHNEKIPEKPHNPMVNSGSILTNALLQTLMKPEMSLAEKFDYVNDYVKVKRYFFKV